MTTPLHPDQLGPDHHVGPWRIVGSLGAGGFGRVFKVERGRQYFALKMALRPAGPHASEEEDINGRLAREVAALLACSPHPHLPRVHAVDRWPDPPNGYFYFVTDFVDGETFHEWRWRVKPTAAHLLSVYTEIVRGVADLHRRGVHHRDLKGDNLLVRREDERPVLIDLGTVRMPGVSTLTVGVAPASPHLLPPECVAFLREGSWQKGAHFDAGVPGDLYALGALLYEALTDGYAFDPKLPYDRLLPAIETVTPRPPHVLNPKVPPVLGDIALRLLAKRPEDRYLSAEALLQALWDAAKEKRQPAWRVSLDVPGEGPGLRLAPQVEDDDEADPPLPPDASLAPPPGAPELEESEAPTPAPVLVRPVEERLVRPADAQQGGGPAQEPLRNPAEEPLSSPAEEHLSRFAEEHLSSLADARPEMPAPGRERRRAAVRVGAGALLVLGLVTLGWIRLAPSSGGVTAPVAPKKGIVPVTRASPPANAALAAAPPADAGTVLPEPLDASFVRTADPVEPAPEPIAKKRRTEPHGALKKASGAAVAACLGAACATVPASLPAAQPTEPCPPGAVEAMRAAGLKYHEWMDGLLVNGTMDESVVKEGPIYALQIGPYSWHSLPEGTRYIGKVFFTEAATHVWINEARMPDGRHIPVCMQFYWQVTARYGYPVQKGDTAVERKLFNPLLLVPVYSFGQDVEVYRRGDYAPR
ncbi:serine/threonine protein kinase [Corallococcus sp. H22C18031201]|nr:serine/threonine protein kinase [Corallococcus sp. H22C18031201]